MRVRASQAVQSDSRTSFAVDCVGRGPQRTIGLGLDRNTETAIGAAVPGLLVGLSGVAAQPGGAQKLVEAVRRQTGAVGNFASLIGAAGQSSLIERGSQMLSSLLGGRDQTALAGAAAALSAGYSPASPTPPPRRRRCQNCGRSRLKSTRSMGVVGQLSAEQRKLLAAIVNPMMPTLNQLFDKVRAIPDVSTASSP